MSLPGSDTDFIEDIASGVTFLITDNLPSPCFAPYSWEDTKQIQITG